ncbi:MAG: protein-L-isoaspartate(D-aspartate) O-methyltransferase [Phycisphaerales bacterium]
MVGRIAAAERLSERSLSALAAVPRHRFVPARFRAESYENHPLPIGSDQTISQPLMVAWLADEVGAGPGRRILEIGTGCGYQAAVLAEAGAEVWSVEIRPELARRARRLLDELGYARVHTKVGDGSRGWIDAAPFDGIVLTAAPREVPESLFEQVREGGVIVAPIGPQGGSQSLVRYTRRGPRDWTTKTLGEVRFVPLVDDAGKGRSRR